MYLWVFHKINYLWIFHNLFGLRVMNFGRSCMKYIYNFCFGFFFCFIITSFLQLIFFIFFLSIISNFYIYLILVWIKTSKSQNIRMWEYILLQQKKGLQPKNNYNTIWQMSCTKKNKKKNYNTIDIHLKL